MSAAGATSARTGTGGTGTDSADTDRTDDVGEIVAGLAETDLRPGPVVNALFAALVSAANSRPEHPLLTDRPALDALHRLCSTGEGHLESCWSTRVAADPWALAAFPYLDNYHDLVRAECRALVDALGRIPRSLVFIGSGPLPLSAVLLAPLLPETLLTCLDRDRRALARGRRMARVLPGGRAVRFVHADATGYDYAGHDIVVLAALVGLTAAAKTAVLAGIARTLDPTALLAARSVPADGRRLLYPRIEPHTVPDTLVVLGESTPPPGVVNSLLLTRPRPGSQVGG